MEEEGSMNFKALRAKFQEEALLAQSRCSRPAVAEKPKHLPPPGGHCSSVLTSINITLESKAFVVPSVCYRDGQRASGGRRPISFPPQPQQTSPSLLSNGERTKKASLKDRCMPLVLPALPVKDQTAEAPAKDGQKLEPEAEKEILPQSKIKKKAQLLPFKSTKPSKASEENGEEPTHTDLTARPCSGSCESPSVEMQAPEEEVALHSDHSTAECPLSSPDIMCTPPPTETSLNSDSRIMSTLEKAKKKFSYKQMLIPNRSKVLPSPDGTSRDRELPSPPKCIENCWADLPVPPPVSLPHLSCISARPFFKASTSARRRGPDKQMGREKARHPCGKTAVSQSLCFLPKKTLPDLTTLGSPPPKPPRPQFGDLGGYHTPSVSKVSPRRSQVQSEEPESEHPSTPPPNVPEFPDMEAKTAEVLAVDFSALKVEPSDFVSGDIHTPVNVRVTNGEVQQPDSLACDTAEASGSSVTQALNPNSPNITSFHPGSFPEPINRSELPEPAQPEPWSHSEEVLVDSFSKPQSDEPDLAAAECRSVPEESGLCRHAAWSDGIQTHSCTYQPDTFCETYDNIYEDVESIHKFMDENSRQQEDAYTGNHTMKEELSVNKWPRNPWEPQSPSTADYKEQKKREKQRLEKERKEQKEREKKENEMKKKFKVTGDEEPLYHAKVKVANKVRKHDLPVKTGDTVCIIRTTNCPKGKWLARDADHKYGYISVMNVELNIKEMLELGKKAQAAGRGVNAEGDNISIGSRSSGHLAQTSSFTDDSEEWACEDETLSPSSDSHSFAQRTASFSEMSCVHVGAQHTLSDANLEVLHTQAGHEALQKLAIFFQQSGTEVSDAPDDHGITPTNDGPSSLLQAVEEPPYPDQEVDFSDLEPLPPPPPYADAT